MNDKLLYLNVKKITTESPGLIMRIINKLCKTSVHKLHKGVLVFDFFPLYFYFVVALPYSLYKFCDF